MGTQKQRLVFILALSLAFNLSVFAEVSRGSSSGAEKKKKSLSSWLLSGEANKAPAQKVQSHKRTYVKREATPVKPAVLPSASKSSSNSKVEQAKARMRQLNTNSSCQSLAQSHSQNLARRNFRITGNGSSHFDFPNRVKAHGVRGAVSELNTPTRASSYEEALLMWMNSPNHRAELMSPKYKSVSVAKSRGTNGIYYWVMCLSSSSS